MAPQESPAEVRATWAALREQWAAEDAERLAERAAAAPPAESKAARDLRWAALRGAGWSLAEIARASNVSRTTVANALRSDRDDERPKTPKPKRKPAAHQLDQLDYTKLTPESRFTFNRLIPLICDGFSRAELGRIYSCSAQDISRRVTQLRKELEAQLD